MVIFCIDATNFSKKQYKSAYQGDLTFRNVITSQIRESTKDDYQLVIYSIGKCERLIGFPELDHVKTVESNSGL